ncbi:hypothetical protein SCHIN_v1c05530 [Spiroplasma chinense]|uniref:Uncharacterized protein n=1 Tax=Spiroplasma chinense TaxID=216932 RepID=A0A5B9Y466_9MOLU|nr:hypothetical protein [Spiroplasma chinense]QEH61750.1 hypothetical protein SCHIN_v1c05530 [Spiroplasma chinense]
MEIREKANLLMIYFAKDEEIMTSIQNVIREYMIIDARVFGHGYFKRMEYGILSKSDPIFFSKYLVEKLVTVTNIQGIIENRELSVMINSVDEQKEMHSGKLFTAVAENEMIITLDILKTD